jgi:hypothetical protein
MVDLIETYVPPARVDPFALGASFEDLLGGASA